MKKVDTHVHSNLSHDGKLPPSSLVRAAKERGIDAFCLTEHCDFDLQYGRCRSVIKWSFLDVEKYYQTYLLTKKALDDDKNNTLNVYFGIEAGFSSKGTASQKYAELIAKYPFDEVINSVHCVCGQEAYFKTFFLFKSKKRAYGEYLDAVLKSLDAPYPYDIVAHIGYILHGAPYRDKALRYADFPDKFDAILKGIIERGKTLEVNFHHEVAPPADVLKRYFELGGRRISYGGDSHRGEIGAHFDEFKALAKAIGFDRYVYFVKRQPVEVLFDD